MKLHFQCLVALMLTLLFSCSNSKEKFNEELSEKMKLDVNYINNKMPTTDNSSGKYISFMVLSNNEPFEENWKTVSLTATSGDIEVKILKFDKNEFESKGEKVYKNNARMGLSELGTVISITVILQSESGNRIKLSKSNIKEETVY